MGSGERNKYRKWRRRRCRRKVELGEGRWEKEKWGRVAAMGRRTFSGGIDATIVRISKFHDSCASMIYSADVFEHDLGELILFKWV